MSCLSTRLLLALATVLTLTSCTSSPPAERRELVWSDEFDGPAGAPPDASRWRLQTGGGGWGNGELQCYTDSTENAATDGRGHLVITADRSSGAPCGERNGWTSARLSTEGLFETTGGRLEVRARLPLGRGTWPAFWALGASMPDRGWPAAGELDVMEHVGNRPGVVSGALHGPTSSGGHWYLHEETSVDVADGRFHTFAAEWRATSVELSVDGRTYGAISRADVARLGSWPWEEPSYLVLNLAVGGTLGGPVPEDAAWPQRLVVDHVRVWR